MSEHETGTEFPQKQRPLPVEVNVWYTTNAQEISREWYVSMPSSIATPSKTSAESETRAQKFVAESLMRAERMGLTIDRLFITSEVDSPSTNTSGQEYLVLNIITGSRTGYHSLNPHEKAVFAQGVYEQLQDMRKKPSA